MRYVSPDTLTTRDPFKSLFPIDPKVLSSVKASMTEAGKFSEDEPIAVWPQPDSPAVVIDGHTRLQAAIDAELNVVAISEHEFTDEDEAVEYAIRRQVHRRNLGDAELARYVLMLDKRRQAGERTDLAQDCARSGKSAETTTEILGVSPRKVEQVRTVLDHADEETREAVLAGDKTVNAAYQETQQKRREQERPDPAVPRPHVFTRPKGHEAPDWSRPYMVVKGRRVDAIDFFNEVMDVLLTDHKTVARVMLKGPRSVDAHTCAYRLRDWAEEYDQALSDMDDNYVVDYHRAQFNRVRHWINKEVKQAWDNDWADCLITERDVPSIINEIDGWVDWATWLKEYLLERTAGNQSE